MDRASCIAQGTLFNVMWQAGWERSLGENGRVYTYGCPPETITTLLISSTPRQTQQFKKQKQLL